MPESKETRVARLVKERNIAKTINDFHFDVNNLYGDWDKGKVSDKQMLIFLKNLSFHLIKQLADFALFIIPDEIK